MPDEEEPMLYMFWRAKIFVFGRNLMGNGQRAIRDFCLDKIQWALVLPLELRGPNPVDMGLIVNGLTGGFMIRSLRLAEPCDVRGRRHE